MVRASLIGQTASMDIENLARLVLADADGVERTLGEYWAERPVVLVFLRHFG